MTFGCWLMLMFFLQQLESLDLGLPRLYQLDSAIVSWGESRWSLVVVFRPSHQKVACERGVANHIVTSVSIEEIVRWVPDSNPAALRVRVHVEGFVEFDFTYFTPCSLFIVQLFLAFKTHSEYDDEWCKRPMCQWMHGPSLLGQWCRTMSSKSMAYCRPLPTTRSMTLHFGWNSPVKLLLLWLFCLNHDNHVGIHHLLDHFL